VSTVDVNVRLVGSCRMVGSVDGHLVQMVEFAGNEPTRFVKCLYEELFIWS